MKRYEPDTYMGDYNGMVEDPDGGWVRFEELEELLAERDRLYAALASRIIADNPAPVKDNANDHKHPVDATVRKWLAEGIADACKIMGGAL